MGTTLSVALAWTMGRPLGTWGGQGGGHPLGDPPSSSGPPPPSSGTPPNLVAPTCTPRPCPPRMRPPGGLWGHRGGSGVTGGPPAPKRVPPPFWGAPRVGGAPRYVWDGLGWGEPCYGVVWMVWGWGPTYMGWGGPMGWHIWGGGSPTLGHPWVSTRGVACPYYPQDTCDACPKLGGVSGWGHVPKFRVLGWGHVSPMGEYGNRAMGPQGIGTGLWDPTGGIWGWGRMSQTGGILGWGHMSPNLGLGLGLCDPMGEYWDGSPGYRDGAMGPQ